MGLIHALMKFKVSVFVCIFTFVFVFVSIFFVCVCVQAYASMSAIVCDYLCCLEDLCVNVCL